MMSKLKSKGQVGVRKEIKPQGEERRKESEVGFECCKKDTWHE